MRNIVDSHPRAPSLHSSLARVSGQRSSAFTPTGYVSPAASLKKKTKMDVVRERCRDNVRDLERVTGGIVRMSRSNNVFTDIFNVE